MTMKQIEETIKYLLGIIALIAGILTLSPDQWKRQLSAWIGFLPFTSPDWRTAFFIAVILSLSLWHYQRRRELQIWPTRKQWWDKKLPQIISKCEKLIVITSYESSKHEFWTELGKRFERRDSFHFIMLTLPESDPFLKYCIDVTEVPKDAVTEIDKKAIKDLIAKRNTSPHASNKTIEHGHWEGISQGPMLVWTIKGKETIATGLWQQIPGSTDLSPWLVTQRGRIYESLKEHYTVLINKARKSGMMTF